MFHCPVQFCECDTPSKHPILLTNRLREQRHIVRLNLIWFKMLSS